MSQALHKAFLLCTVLRTLVNFSTEHTLFCTKLNQKSYFWQYFRIKVQGTTGQINLEGKFSELSVYFAGN